ncbi:MAG: hypothetical protein JRG73_20895 [Deltaproteobacteria bacterium]|nr:hypothetical protein [Deltaproteobacteria bacterium]
MPSVEKWEICGKLIQPHETAFLLNERVVCGACREEQKIRDETGETGYAQQYKAAELRKLAKGVDQEAANEIELLTQPTAWIVTLLEWLAAFCLLTGFVSVLFAAGNEAAPFVIASLVIGGIVGPIILLVLAVCLKIHFERLAQIVSGIESLNAQVEQKKA